MLNLMVDNTFDISVTEIISTWSSHEHLSHINIHINSCTHSVQTEHVLIHSQYLPLIHMWTSSISNNGPTYDILYIDYHT